MSNPYDVVPTPNIAGAGNYAQMLQSALSGLGKPKQQQKQPAPGIPATPGQPASNFAPATPPGAPQQNYVQQLLQSLFSRGS